MRSSTGLLSRGVEPLAPLRAPVHWLAATSLHVGIGIALGGLAARAMHGRGMRWTWPACGLCLLVLLRPVSGELGWTLAAAALTATARCRSRHREDLACGADLADRAAARRGPLDLLRLLARLGAARLGIGGRDWLGGEDLIVGQDADRRPVRIPLGGPGGGTHVLIAGAAGSGKTVTQTWIAARAIEYGLPAVIVDPKDDPDLQEQVQSAARRSGRRLIEWSPDGPTVFNPFAHGGETEIADKALAGERFTEPHYMRQAQRFLGHEVRALRAAGMPVSLASLAEHLDPERLESLLRGLPEEPASSGFEYLDSLTPRQRADLSGVRDRLSIVAESDVGRWIDPRAQGAERFELLSALRSGSVVLFRLRADERPLLMQMLGAAIVGDLSTTMAALQRTPIPSIAVIDEFAALAARQIGGLFARARGAGMSLVLSTQELSDLEVGGSVGLRRQVEGNLTTTIAHRQVVPESAQRVAQLSGERPVWRRTFGSGGHRTETRVTEPVVSAEQVRSLPRGCAAVIVHAGRHSGARIAQMHSVKHMR